MAELPFAMELEWSGSGGEGAGRIVTDDLELEFSVPASMGGRGVGSNPEELLVCAVGACYSATLNGVLRRAGLPASGVRVAATGTVSGYPEQARFAQLTVSPTILGGDASRSVEYDQAARAAHERCFIGRTIAGNSGCRAGRRRRSVTATRATWPRSDGNGPSPRSAGCSSVAPSPG